MAKFGGGFRERTPEDVAWEASVAARPAGAWVGDYQGKASGVAAGSYLQGANGSAPVWAGRDWQATDADRGYQAETAAYVASRNARPGTPAAGEGLATPRSPAPRATGMAGNALSAASAASAPRAAAPGFAGVAQLGARPAAPVMAPGFQASQNALNLGAPRKGFGNVGRR